MKIGTTWMPNNGVTEMIAPTLDYLWGAVFGNAEKVAECVGDQIKDASGHCIDKADKIAECLANQTRVNGQCVDIIAQCLADQTIVDGKCVAKSAEKAAPKDWYTTLRNWIWGAGAVIVTFAGKKAYDKLVNSDEKDLKQNLKDLEFTDEQITLLGSDKEAMAFIISAADKTNPLSNKAILDLAKTDSEAFVQFAQQGKSDEFMVGFFGDENTPTKDEAKVKIIADTVATLKKAAPAKPVTPAPAPAKPVTPAPAPAKPVTPAPAKPETPAPVKPAAPQTVVPANPAAPKRVVNTVNRP